MVVAINSNKKYLNWNRHLSLAQKMQKHSPWHWFNSTCRLYNHHESKELHQQHQWNIFLVKRKHISQAINWMKRRGKTFKKLLVNATGSQELSDWTLRFIHVTLVQGLKVTAETVLSDGCDVTFYVNKSLSDLVHADRDSLSATA